MQENVAAIGSGTMSASPATNSPTSVARLNRAGGPPTKESSFNAKSAAAAGDGGASSSLSIVFNASWVRLAAPIGEGAFSRVYEGVYRNPETLEESVVAVKILKKNMLKRRSDCLRFIKEAKIMTKISHSHIAACYGIGKYEDDDPHNPGSLFIVQELVRGGNLLHKVYKQMLNRNKCVYTSQEALNWMIDVASGMAYLHAVTDTKPMIIHRDLKLENIMLAPEQNRVTAKLVDFGLHKVIDDRIKKVVKRVISEANLGGRLGRLRAQQAGDDDNIEDELEAALAEQQAIVMASSVKPGAAATASPLGTTTPVGRRLPARAASRLNIESSGLMGSMPEDDGKDNEVEQREEEAKEVGPVSAGDASTQRTSGGSKSNPEEGASEVVPAIAKIRAPVKKQSSMQKLMAKMKEIKFRVTGNVTKDGAPTLVTSNLSRGDSLTQATSPLADASPRGAQTTSNRSSGVSFACPSATLTHSGVGGGGGSSVKFSLPQAATEVVGPLSALDERKARNVQLLDKIVAQQSVAEGRSHVMDDLGLIDGGGAKKPRAPPRRAITMINEIRYNLTEAVGSWAYMAPEVVLGQPYNEKVDVFSFGVILFEVLNRKLMLVDEIKNDPRKDAQAYAERVARGFRPEIPKYWPEALSELIGACWAQDPHCRPNFAAVVDALHELDAEGVVSKLDVRFWSRGNAFI